MSWHKEPRRHSLARRGIKKANKDVQDRVISKEIVSPRQKRIDYLVDEMEESKFRDNGIKDVSFAKKLINERMSDEKLNDEVFNHLSKDKSSGELFDKQNTDPTLPIVFVDTNFLSERKGNQINQKIVGRGAFGKSVEKITNLVDKDKKISSVPFYDMKRKTVGEGNHRVEALKQLGYKSVPVKLINSWD